MRSRRPRLPRRRGSRDPAARSTPAPKIMKRPGKWLDAHKAIEIVEEGGVRVLQIGGSAIQSATRLDSPEPIEPHYGRAMIGFLLFRPDPREELTRWLCG